MVLEMRFTLSILFFTSLNVYTNCQDVRLGLLAQTHLGQNPTGGSSSFGGNNVPLIGNILDGRTQPRRLCCCSVSSSCPNVYNEDDDYFDYDTVSGVIDPRVGLRIANRPPLLGLNQPSSVVSCPIGRTKCCYDNVRSLKHLQNQCSTTGQSEPFQQSCSANIPFGGHTCGTRNFNHVPGRSFGQSSPEEFPWSCLILTRNDEFVGTCVVVPERFDNQIQFNTKKILTVAHKVRNYNFNDLKVRVLDYDASGFNSPERRRHEEYGVFTIIIHPQFDPIRLTNDIAVIKVDRAINLQRPGVNAACFPSCQNMFGNVFRNGTGARCWVAGWGKDSIDGSFKVIQNKVDVPIVPNQRCESLLKLALSQRNQQVARNFRLHPSEICAGGEIGKDACDGDGGAPLVCESIEGQWHVIGLVTWGVGCANRDVPGVYAKISYFRNWLERI